MQTFSELWWVLPVSVVFSTVAIGSGVSGALFFSPFFMLVVGLAPAQAVGAGLLTEVFVMGNGLRAYVRAKLVDYATARWLLLGAIPAVIVGAIAADLLSDRLLKGIFGIGLLVLAAFLVLVRSPEECEDSDERFYPRARCGGGRRGSCALGAAGVAGCGLEYPGCLDRQHHRKPRREIPSRQGHGERLGRRVRKRGDSGFGPRVHSVGSAHRPLVLG